MAYDAPDFSTILFDEQGKPYWRTASGGRSYLPPLAAMQSNNPRAVEWARSMGVHRTADGQVVNQSAPGGSLFKERGHWDPEQGGWAQDTNWNNILAMGTGAMIGAPYLGAALGGGTAAAEGAAGAGATSPALGGVTPAAVGGGLSLIHI